MKRFIPRIQYQMNVWKTDKKWNEPEYQKRYLISELINEMRALSYLITQVYLLSVRDASK